MNAAFMQFKRSSSSDMNAAFMQFGPRAGRSGGGGPGPAGRHASHNGTTRRHRSLARRPGGTCYAGKAGTSTVKNR
jgi:hypothetical protein